MTLLITSESLTHFHQYSYKVYFCVDLHSFSMYQILVTHTYKYKVNNSISKCVYGTSIYSAFCLFSNFSNMKYELAINEVGKKNHLKFSLFKLE